MKPGQTASFEVIPAVDILGGKCVRLAQGKYDAVTVYYDDPSDAVLRWLKAGAKRIHIVDLDGAKTGKPINAEVIESVLQSSSKTAPTSSSPCTFQIGGGIRSLTTIELYINMGADRVILGSQALSDPRFVELACSKFGAKIAVSLDARGFTAATEGWLKSSGKDLSVVIPELGKLGVRRLIYTDIARDGMLTGPNLESIREVAQLSPVPVIASGGVSSDADIDALRNLFTDGVEGCIVGKALYEGEIALSSIYLRD